MAPRLWLALKPIHASHIVVWRVKTGEVLFIPSTTLGSRAKNLLEKKVKARWTLPRRPKMEAPIIRRAFAMRGCRSPPKAQKIISYPHSAVVLGLLNLLKKMEASSFALQIPEISGRVRHERDSDSGFKNIGSKKTLRSPTSQGQLIPDGRLSPTYKYLIGTFPSRLQSTADLRAFSVAQLTFCIRERGRCVKRFSLKIRQKAHQRTLGFARVF